MADNEIRNPSKAYFKWKMPVIAKSEDDWNFWNTEDKYNRTMFIGYNDTTTPHVASLFMIIDGKAMQAVGDDVIARISKMETDVAEALNDIQELINMANEQQQTIMQLQQQVQAVLLEVQGYVEDAHTWAEGTDEEVADLGGEHSAKGWAQKANDIVAAGLPSDATFDHLTVTGSSKFGQDPDRANQPGLEIEGTGEIQAYRTVNMMNGATVSYDETVEMPWSDSSNKVPNTAWVQQAVQHGTIDPNTELTVKRISTSTGGAFLYAEHTNSNGHKKYAYLSIPKNSGDTTHYVSCSASDASDGTSSTVQVYPSFISVDGNSVVIEGAKSRWSNSKSTVEIGSLNTSSSDTRLACLGYTGCFQNGFFVGRELELSDDGRPFKVMRTGTGLGSWEAAFGVTPTVPDITDAADSSDKVPNTKWVQAAIAAGGGGGSGTVTSVNGKTGEVVLAATDVGAATTADITTALEPYAKTADVTTTLADYAKSADVTTEITTATAGLQPKLTAGANITISEDNVISATGGGTGGAVTSVNGKTGEVVLNASDVGAITGAEADTKITTALEPYAKTADVTTTLEPYAKSADVTAEITAAVAPMATTEALTTGLAGKQDKLTAGSGIAISDTNVISATVSSPVDSVNGKTGAVVLSASDVGAASNSDLASYVTTDAMNTELTNFATTASVDTKLADYQRKLIAGDGIAISESNIISVTGGTGGGAVTSVNGNTGAVVLTGDNIMTASDSTTSINSALSGKQNSITADTELTCKSVTTSYDSALNSINYAGNISFTGDAGNGSVGKITANELFTNASGYYGTRIQASGIKCTSGAGGTTWFNLNSSDKTISVDGTITATSPSADANNNQVATTAWVKTAIAGGGGGGGAVTSVNGNTGAVVLTADNVMLTDLSTTSINTALAGKQDSLTEASDLTVGYITAGSADSGLCAGRYSIRFTSNGNDKLFVDATGPYVSNLTGGDLGPATGAFNWYINTTTDYNKFNVFNRYHVTNEETHEVTTNDTSVLSIGGSPTDHSTWIDFTATYMSFKGNTNFGEAGMNHAMNFNGPSTFTGTATVHELIAGDGYEGSVFTCNANAWLNYDNRIGWDSGRLRCARTDDDFMFDFNHSASAGQRIRFNDTVTVLSAMPDATDSSNIVPTTAWVQGVAAIKANLNADNFSVAGKSALSGMGMPSDRCIDLTLGASGTTYTAPANGWFSLDTWTTSTASAYYHLHNRTSKLALLAVPDQGHGYQQKGFIPCKAGDIVAFIYANIDTTKTKWCFIYAQGEQ